MHYPTRSRQDHAAYVTVRPDGAPELRIEHFNCMYKVFHGSKRWRSQTGFPVEEQHCDQEPLSKIA
jgi:hypothetical protein